MNNASDYGFSVDGQLPQPTKQYIVKGRSIDGTVYFGGGMVWTSRKNAATRMDFSKAEHLVASLVNWNKTHSSDPDSRIGRFEVIPAPVISSAEYDSYVHTHVTVSHPGTEFDIMGGPFEITHVVGERIWIFVSHEFVGSNDDIIVVTDGIGDGFDEDGSCLVSIPKEWCKFWNDDDAFSIELGIDAEQSLRSYAK